MKNRVVLVCICGIAMAGCAGNKDEVPEIVQIERVEPYHTVDEGDTVGSVATKYGMKREDLVKMNKLEPPYQLYNGQRLIVIPKTGDSQGEVQDQLTAETAPETGETPQEEAPATETEQLNGEEEQLDDGEVESKKKSDYVWPIENGKNKITQKFKDGDSDGIVMDVSVGTPVKAVADGVVKIAGVPGGDAAAYGVTIVVKHPKLKTMSIYSNLKEASVKMDQKVKQGEVIGKSGQSGTIASGPQLYFEVSDLSGKGRKAVDPEKLLPQ
jgi:lipoprotein NlpD